MSNHTSAHVVRRPLRRAGILAAVALWLTLSAGSVAQADDGGLLGDATGTLGGAADQALDPALQTVQSTVPEPVQQAVEPVVQPAVEPVLSDVDQTVEAVVRDADQTVKATVRVVEQAVAPVVRVVEPAGRRAEQPAATPDDPVVEPARASAPAPPAPQAQAPAIARTTGTQSAVVAVQTGAEQAPAGKPGRVDGERRARAADLPALTDLAPRSAAALPVLRDLGTNDAFRDGDGTRPDARLWALTNELMHMWAGQDAPGGVDAGLAGAREPRTPTPGAFDTAPILLGLLFGFLSLVVARRVHGVPGTAGT